MSSKLMSETAVKGITISFVLSCTLLSSSGTSFLLDSFSAVSLLFSVPGFSVLFSFETTSFIGFDVSALSSDGCGKLNVFASSEALDLPSVLSSVPVPG